jgi:hypothetical protein
MMPARNGLRKRNEAWSVYWDFEGHHASLFERALTPGATKLKHEGELRSST